MVVGSVPTDAPVGTPPVQAALGTDKPGRSIIEISVGLLVRFTQPVALDTSCPFVVHIGSPHNSNVVDPEHLICVSSHAQGVQVRVSM